MLSAVEIEELDSERDGTLCLKARIWRQAGEHQLEIYEGPVWARTLVLQAGESLLFLSGAGIDLPAISLNSPEAREGLFSVISGFYAELGPLRETLPA